MVSILIKKTTLSDHRKCQMPIFRTLLPRKSLFVANVSPPQKGYLLRRNVYLLPRKGYPQDALFAGKKVELSAVNKVIPSDKLERGICFSVS